jgi:ADP-ribosylglycohydrolase
MKPDLDRYTGCLLGLALGDALGAPYEGGLLERALWKLLGRNAEGLPRWTDDTRMSLDLAESLLSCEQLDADDLAKRFAASYRWSRGYGPSTARLLKSIRRGRSWQEASRAVYPQGSYGNGGAMRSAVIALYMPGDVQRLVELSREQARVTHSHVLGMEGAVLIALAAQAMLAERTVAQTMDLLTQKITQPELLQPLTSARTLLTAAVQPSPRDVARQFGNGMTAQTSCVTALVLALSHLERNFDALLLAARQCGGDVDTISAMAGAIWGARNGARTLPDTPIEEREYIVTVASRLAQAALLGGTS